MIKHNRPTISLLELSRICKIFFTRNLLTGTEVRKFESLVDQFFSTPSGSSIAVSTGSAAIYIAIKALKLEGKRVALPVYSCSSIAHSIRLAGAIPAFVDSSKESPNMDLKYVFENLKNFDAIFLVDTFGIVNNDEIINQIPLPIIHDISHSLGTLNSTGIPFRLGDICLFSTSATKLITTAGKGGVVISTNPKINSRIRNLLNFDGNPDPQNHFNFSMSDFEAAFGIVQLKRLPKLIEKREKIFQIYKSKLKNLFEIKTDYLRVSRYRAIVQSENPDKMIATLNKARIKAIRPFELNEFSQQIFEFPNALFFIRNLVSIPIYPSLSFRKVKKICKILINLDKN